MLWLSRKLNAFLSRDLRPISLVQTDRQFLFRKLPDLLCRVVLIFFIAGLLFIGASSTSITWERTASRLETGLVIPSVYDSYHRWSQIVVKHVTGDSKSLPDRKEAADPNQVAWVIQRESLEKMLPFRTRQIRSAHLMQHLANHSTYHRGQVALMMRQLGAEPLATDCHVFLVERRH
jgi:hypothetical protein